MFCSASNYADGNKLTQDEQWRDHAHLAVCAVDARVLGLARLHRLQPGRLGVGHARGMRIQQIAVQHRFQRFEVARDHRGEVALVTGRAAIEADIGGQPRSLKLLFLNAWAKTPEGWKFVAWQSTPLAA
jgi:hypothetical protein